MFNGDPKYVSKYQGPLSATLNYPMYYKLKDAFQSKSSMREIHDGVDAVSTKMENNYFIYYEHYFFILQELYIQRCFSSGNIC